MADDTVKVISLQSVKKANEILSQQNDVLQETSLIQLMMDHKHNLMDDLQLIEIYSCDNVFNQNQIIGVDILVLANQIIKGDDNFTQVVQFAILTQNGTVEKFEVEIEGETKVLKSLKSESIGSKVQIVEMLAHNLDLGENVDKPYLGSSLSTKCMLIVINEKSLLEVLFLQIFKDSVKTIWRQALPEQSSKATVSTATRINQRGAVVPVNSQSMISTALTAVYNGITSVAQPLLQLSTPSKDLGYDVEARMSRMFATVFTRNVKKNWYNLYIYDHQQQNRYLGYLNLLNFIEFDGYDQSVLLKSGFEIDYQVSSTFADSEAILMAAVDSVYVIALCRVSNVWKTLRRIKNVSGIHVSLQKSLIISGTRSPLVFVNSQMIAISEYPDAQQLQIADKTSGKQGQDANKKDDQILPLLQFEQQISHPLYSVDILEDLFIHGKKDFIMKIFIKINEALMREFTHLDHLKAKSEPSSPVRNVPEVSAQEIKISTIVYGSLKSLLSEIDTYVDSQVVQRDQLAQDTQEDGKGKPQNAKKDNNFDDFFGGGDSDDDFDLMDGGLIDFDNLQAAPPKEKTEKKEEEKKPAAPEVSSSEQQFAEIQEDLLRNLAKSADFGGIQLIDFLLKFNSIHAKEFFSDEMASILLRQIYLETENVDRGKLAELTKKDTEQGGTKVTKKLAMHEVYAQMYGEENEAFLAVEYQKGKGNLALLGKWNSRKCALALFTVNQDVVLEELQERLDIESHASWSLVRDLCLPVWIKDSYRLRGIVEWVSKIAYKEQGDENQRSAGSGSPPKSQAEAASLWYILMNKKQVLINLFEKEKATGGDKVATMLSKDFTVERWKKAAIKNAAVLQAKHRYLLCATFLILGDDLTNALQIMKNKKFLGDPIMAILTCRMLILQQPDNSELPKMLSELWQEFFIERGENHGDVYLKAVGLWGQEKYVQALNSLQDEVRQSDPTIDFMFKQESGFLLRTEKSGGQAAKDLYSPVVTELSGTDLNVMIQKLKKAPKVTAALNKESASTGYGADAGALDFWAAPEVKKQDADKVEEEKPVVTIDSAQILAQMLQVYLSNHDMMSALFLLRENREFINPRMERQSNCIRMICTQIMKDLIYEIAQNPSYLSPVESIYNQIESLLGFVLDFDPQDARIRKEEPRVKQSTSFSDKEELEILKSYLRRCIEIDILQILKTLQGSKGSNKGSSTLLRYELELRLEVRQRLPSNFAIPRNHCSMKSILSRLDEQTFKFLHFVTSTCRAPDLRNRKRQHDLVNLKQYKEIILELEQHIDCLIIYDHFEDSQEGSGEDGEDARRVESLDQFLKERVNADKNEFLFFTEKDEVPPQGPAEVKKVEKKRDDPFDDLMGGDDDSDGIDLMDMDFSAPPKKAAVKPPKTEIKQEEPAPKRASITFFQEDESDSEFLRKFEQATSMIQRLSSKVRKSLIMHICLMILSFQMRKFYIFRDLTSAEDLQKLFQVKSQLLLDSLKTCHELKNQMSARAQHPQFISKLDSVLEDVRGQYSKIHFQNLKTYIQKFKCAIEKKLSQSVDLRGAVPEQEEEEPDFSAPFGANLQKSDKLVEENVWQEVWETDLLNAKDVYSNQIYTNENAEAQALGSLAKHEQVVPNSYEFLQLWLQFIIIHKSKEILSQHVSGVFAQFIELNPSVSLLRFPSSKPEHHEAIRQVNKLQCQNELELCQIDLLFKSSFSCKEICDLFASMSDSLENECTLFFEQKLTLVQRKFLVTQIKQNTPQMFPVLMKYFFKNTQKMNEFWSHLSVASQYVKPLFAQSLTLLSAASTAEQDELESLENLTYPVDLGAQQEQLDKSPVKQKEEKHASKWSVTPSQVLVRELLGTGIEVFKQRGEQISDFAFDNTSNSDNIAMGLMASGIREIPVVSTLVFRNRIESGLQLIDEENLEWGECLHRYEPIEQIMYGDAHDNQKQSAVISEKDDPIVAAIDSLYSQKTIFQRLRPSLAAKPLLSGFQQKPPPSWNGCDSSLFLTSKSKLDITHEDYTFPLDSHPFLPLYVSGNRRGILSAWKFGQSEDKSLYQYMPEVDPRQADPKKACVKKIMFNSYGDKIMSNNIEGSFCIYQMDGHSKKSRKVPIFSLYENQDSKVSDFDLVNSDNILCTISSKQKTIKIYDTLLPYSYGKQGCVMEYKQQKSEAWGNIVLCNQRKQVIYTFNGRTGLMAELDLRMNLNMITQHQLSQSQEITAVCLNQANDTLITGYKDGHVKIHSTHQYYESNETRDMKLREKIEAFPFDFRSKKGLVQRIKINQKNGGLFASSQSGTLKLLRTKV